MPRLKILRILLCVVLCFPYYVNIPTSYSQGTLAPQARFQFMNNNGVNCNACLLYTYAAGTETNLATYSDSALSVANQNPIVMNSSGRPAHSGAEIAIYLSAAAYKFVLKTSAGVTIWTQDNISPYNIYTTVFATQLDDKVCHASQYTGATAGAKWAACISALPSTGGTIDTRGLEGAQTISSDIFSGVTKPLHIIVGAATYTLSASSTVPATVNLEVQRGGSFSINSGITLTINGGLKAGFYRIFSGSGLVRLPEFDSGTAPRISEVYPEWWGGVPDGSTDSAAAIQAAFDSRSRRIFLNCGLWRISASIIITLGNWELSGCGASTPTFLSPSATSIGSPNALLVMRMDPNAGEFCNCTIEDIRWNTNGVAFTGWGIWAEQNGPTSYPLFSATIRNNWIDPPSVASGFFHGVLNSSNVYGNIFENVILPFDLVGFGNEANQFRGNQCYQCFGFLKHDSETYTINASPGGLVRATNVTTVTTSSAHGLVTGRSVMVFGGTSVNGTNFNGAWGPITVTGATTFTYPDTASNDTGGGGTLITNFLWDNQVTDLIMYSYDGNNNHAIFDIEGARDLTIDNVVVENVTATSTLLGTLGSFSYVLDGSFSNFTQRHIDGSQRGILFNNAKMKVGPGFIDGSFPAASTNRPIRITGSDNDITLSNLTVHGGALIQVELATSGGNLRIFDSYFDRGEKAFMQNTGTETIDIEIGGSTILNGSFDSGASVVNMFEMATSGRVYLHDSTIGVTNPLSVPPNLIRFQGSGTITTGNMRYIGSVTVWSAGSTQPRSEGPSLNITSGNRWYTTNLDVSGSLSIGGGSQIAIARTVNTSLDFGAITANTCSEGTVAVTGAATGDTVVVTPTATFSVTACGAVPSCLSTTGYVGSAGNVTVRVCNVSGTVSSDPAAADFRVLLFKY